MMLTVELSALLEERERERDAFKFCQQARVDNVVYGLSLATITGR